jgi:2-dehydro-3-deoxyphosphogluconate aldolase/(4S)-4-hydroxy-2-oxoglutarate aldolase
LSSDTLKTLLDDGVVLCFRFGPGQPILEPARAAMRGGLKTLEITLTTPGALEAMTALSRETDALVGGGTVLTAEDVRAVARAGGRFALSPVFDAGALAAAKEAGLLYIPGAATPGEILTAYRAGAPVVKVFPSAPLGGPQFLRFVRGPLGAIPLLPTSGPTSENLADYFDAGAVAVGVGPEVFPPGFTLEGVEQAARRVRRAVDAWRAGRGRG